MAGLSGANMLFIVDEASGFDERIFEAIEGNRAGGARLILFSNPTQTSGTFFDAFHSKREFWHPEHVSGLDVPDMPGTGMTTRAWVEEKRREWGESDPRFQVRALGNFPSAASDAVISLSVLEYSQQRWEDTEAKGPLHLGVDVARFGDDSTVIAARRGKKILSLWPVREFDTVQVTSEVVATARKLRVEPGEVVRVAVDGIGIGAGVVDQLRHVPRETAALDVHEVNSSNRATSEDEFFNLRSQLAFAVADWIADGGALPRDGELESELLSLKYAFDARGRRKVLSKDEMKKSLGRSPDRADAIALAVFTPPTGGGARSISGDGSRWSEESRGFG